jgi:plasmid stability protein
MVMIQIRNVPEDLHRKLKVRAAERGQTLSDYLLEVVRLEAAQPTLEEFVRMVKSREPVHLEQTSAEIVRELREEMG